MFINGGSVILIQYSNERTFYVFQRQLVCWLTKAIGIYWFIQARKLTRFILCVRIKVVVAVLASIVAQVLRCFNSGEIRYPTDPFTTLELQNPSRDVSELLREFRLSPDIEALKFWKGWSGIRCPSSWSCNTNLSPANWSGNFKLWQAGYPRGPWHECRLNYKLLGEREELETQFQMRSFALYHQFRFVSAFRGKGFVTWFFLLKKLEWYKCVLHNFYFQSSAFFLPVSLL